MKTIQLCSIRDFFSAMRTSLHDLLLSNRNGAWSSTTSRPPRNREAFLVPFGVVWWDTIWVKKMDFVFRIKTSMIVFCVAIVVLVVVVHVLLHVVFYVGFSILLTFFRYIKIHTTNSNMTHSVSSWVSRLHKQMNRKYKKMIVMISSQVDLM